MQHDAIHFNYLSYSNPYLFGHFLEQIFEHYQLILIFVIKWDDTLSAAFLNVKTFLKPSVMQIFHFNFNSVLYVLWRTIKQAEDGP